MRIGSTSKTFTVTAILLPADQGKLGLDDPIDRYVTGVPSGNQIKTTTAPPPTLLPQMFRGSDAEPGEVDPGAPSGPVSTLGGPAEPPMVPVVVS